MIAIHDLKNKANIRQYIALNKYKVTSSLVTDGTTEQRKDDHELQKSDARRNTKNDKSQTKVTNYKEEKFL